MPSRQNQPQKKRGPSKSQSSSDRGRKKRIDSGNERRRKEDSRSKERSNPQGRDGHRKDPDRKKRHPNNGGRSNSKNRSGGSHHNEGYELEGPMASGKGQSLPPSYQPYPSYPPNQDWLVPQALADTAHALANVSLGGPHPPGFTQTHTQVTVAPLTHPIDDRLYFNCAMIFFFWPVAIFAILKSLKCREAISSGDVQEAQRLAATAKKLGLIALGLGIFCIVGGVVLGVINNLYWAASPAACYGTGCYV